MNQQDKINKLEELQDKFFCEIKKELKKDPFVQAMFKMYKMDLSVLDKIEMSFEDDMEVSAKTKGAKIFINPELLKEGDSFDDHKHYLIHELLHVLDILTNNIDEKENEKEDYLENQNELDAFQVQILYKLLHDGPKEVKRYVKQVLDHHNVPKHKKEEKEKDLMGEHVHKAVK